MGFFRDILGGGGDLYRSITPKELRGLAPKEIQPGGFDPARDFLGYDIKANPERDAMIARQQEADAAQQAFNQVRGSSGMPQVSMNPDGTRMVNTGLLAGFNIGRGSGMSGNGVDYSGTPNRIAYGLLGGPTPPATGTAPTPGSYSAQAHQLAGLLGNQGPRPVMNQPYTPGRFMPGFRPGMDQPIPYSGGFQGSADRPGMRRY